MENWIDLNSIPQRDFGSKKVYDWKNAIGFVCKFNCNNISGFLEIVGYDSKTHLLSVLYNNEIKTIARDSSIKVNPSLEVFLTMSILYHTPKNKKRGIAAPEKGKYYEKYYCTVAGPRLLQTYIWRLDLRC